ncbi:MAG: hypothetical protein ACPHL6_09305, partial [Rubripirellula sp.]
WETLMFNSTFRVQNPRECDAVDDLQATRNTATDNLHSTRPDSMKQGLFIDSGFDSSYIVRPA